jgi:hypothetical protein
LRRRCKPADLPRKGSRAAKQVHAAAVRRDLEPIELPPPHLAPTGDPPTDDEIVELEDVGEQPIEDLDPKVADDEARREGEGPERN